MGRFLSELRRRKVFHVAAVYAVTAWLLAQGLALVAATYGAPDWVQPMVIALLLAGFPIAIILAWAFDVTPDGLRATSPAESTEGTGSGVRFAVIGGSLLSLLVLAGTLAYFYLTPSDQTVIEIVSDRPPSIAVLPFVDMSEDGDQEYFGDGLAEELLDELSRAEGLRVIARTSSFQFKGRNVDIRDIGEALDVTHILEGSIRKAGLRIRITAQLIDVANGSHIWSQQFDRNLDDIFAIQDEIAAAISSQLKVSLLGRPERHQPSIDHYEQYLIANALSQTGHEDSLRAVETLEKVLMEDPEFIQAHLLLAKLYALNAVYGAQDTRTEYARMTPHIDYILNFEPENPEALMLEDWIDWAQTGNFPQFLKEASQLYERFPDDQAVTENLLWGFLDFPEPEYGPVIQSITRKLLRNDPFNVGLLRWSGSGHFIAGDIDGAERQWRFAASLGDKDEYIHQSYLFRLALLKGNFIEAETIIEAMTDGGPPNSALELLRRVELEATRGDMEAAARYEADLQRLSREIFFTPGIMFLANAALGRDDLAIKYLENGITIFDEPSFHLFGLLDLHFPPYGDRYDGHPAVQALRDQAFGAGTDAIWRDIVNSLEEFKK